MISQFVQLVLFLLRRQRIELVAMERVEKTILKQVGPFPPGTKCLVSRARPDAMTVFEFDDGSVAEFPPFTVWIGGVDHHPDDVFYTLISMISFMYLIHEKY